MNGRLIADRYRLTEPLGKGAMGQVWGGVDLGLGERRVAVKLMRSDQMASPSEGADPDKLRKRFERECRITAQIDHPGLVAVHDAGQDDGELFLVMQRVEGSDLSDHLAEHEPYPWSWAVAVAAQMCSALAALHEREVVHRDLKPSNAMVRPDGRVVLLDLGVAAVRSAGDTTRLTGTGTGVGTPVYMAPEQEVGGASVGPRSDLYALGVVLYELLTGQVPFAAPEWSGVAYKKKHERPVPVREVRSEVPEALESLVERLLDKEPEERPADAHEVYAALAPLLPGIGADRAVLPLDPTRPFREPMAPWPPLRQDTASPPPPPPSAPPSDLTATVGAARQLLAVGDYSRVTELLGRALSTATAEYGESSEVVRSLRKQYAAVLLDTGQYARALPEIERLVWEFTAERGPHDPVVLQLRRDEAMCRRQLGR